MANLDPNLTPEQEAVAEADWLAWSEGRPQIIRDLAKRFRPWKLYLLKSSKHRVIPISFNEAGTVTVAVLGKYNLLSMERQVFGIDPDNLEECDLPAPDELVGVYLTEEEQRLMVNRRRAENGLPSLTMAEFRRLGEDHEPYVPGPNGEPGGEPLDRDVPPPEIKEP